MATPTQQEMTVSTPSEITAGKNTRPIDKFKTYANSPEVLESFKRVLGNDKLAQMYVGSIIVAVYNKEELQACSPKSIMVSAMRAAYLRLSVDPAMKQAHLVPYGSDATLIVDYHGLVQLMTNTGLYADVNVSEVFEGEEVKTRRPSSKVEIIGEKISNTVIGYCAYLLMHNGIEKYLYMTNEQCDEHGKKYSKAYNSQKSPWNSNGGRDRPAMRRKTALRCLANQWGQYSPYASAVLKGDDGVIDGMAVDMPDEDKVSKLSAPQKSNKALMASLGYDDERTETEKKSEMEDFSDWASRATRAEIERALSEGANAWEREILASELATRPTETEPMLRYNASAITMAVAGEWDEAPAKVQAILHNLFTSGEIPESMTVSEARLIKRPGLTTIEGIPA